MFITTDLSTETSLASRQNPRTLAGATTPQTSSAATPDSAAGQLDPSLQRQADIPAAVQDTQWEIQSEHAAGQAVDSLRQSMTGQPATALAAQANQLSQNVLSLLQSTD